VIFVLLLSFAFIFFVAKAYYDTNAIEIKHYQIKNSPLGEVFQGLKIAHLSDLHIKHYGVREKKALNILEKENPDLIFLTGDYIHFDTPYTAVTSFFRELKAPFGVYAVLGNTEYSNENGSCVLCHEERSKSLREKNNVQFLRNSFVHFKVNGKAINIIGVDDPVEKRSDLRTTLKGVNPNEPSILLAHSPEIFEEASNRGIDFLLSGHTHGGQIFITKILRNILPLDPTLEFLGGFLQEGRTLMYVSQGMGTSFLPFRLGVKPELTFFEFSNNTNEETNDTNENIRIARMYPTNSSNPSNPMECTPETGQNMLE
jgi:predicted MPP superfamily phosphohydrolase